MEIHKDKFSSLKSLPYYQKLYIKKKGKNIESDKHLNRRRIQRKHRLLPIGDSMESFVEEVAFATEPSSFVKF